MQKQCFYLNHASTSFFVANGWSLDPALMGSNLSVVDLGSGFTIESVAIGYRHYCALSTTNAVKCWGYGSYLGLGSAQRRIDRKNSSHMGDNLLALTFPGGALPVQLDVGAYASCVVSDAGQVYCWGDGSAGLGFLCART